MRFLFVCSSFCMTCILLGPVFLKRRGPNVAVFASSDSLWGHQFCQQSSGTKSCFMNADYGNETVTFAFNKSSDTVNFVHFCFF